MNILSFEMYDESTFQDLEPEAMVEAIDIALESAATVERFYELGPEGREVARGTMHRAYESAMRALHADAWSFQPTYAMESAGAVLAMEEDEGFLKRIWNAIKDAVKWLLDKIGLGSENAEKADEAIQSSVDKGIAKIKTKFDNDGRMLHQRTLTGFPQFGKGRVNAKKLLDYVRQDLGGTHKSVISLADALTKLVKESRDFVKRGDFVTRSQANIDKTFKVGEALNKILETNIPAVPDLNRIAKHESVTTFADTLKTKINNNNVRGYGPFVRNGHVLWLRHNDVTSRWSTRGFDDLTDKKEPSAVVEFGNSQDYAKDSIEILEAIGEEKANVEIAKVVDDLGKAVKEWFAVVESTVEKDGEHARKAVLRHAREVMSSVNANIHSINAVRTMSKNSGQALIRILISEGDEEEAKQAEAEHKEKEDKKKAKADAKAAKEGDKSTDAPPSN